MFQRVLQVRRMMVMKIVRNKSRRRERICRKREVGVYLVKRIQKMKGHLKMNKIIEVLQRVLWMMKWM
jgi:hypothetical protein